MKFRWIFHGTADFLFPERCVLCGEYLFFRNRIGFYPLCSSCVRKLRSPSGARCRRCSMPLVSENDLCMECRDREFFFEHNYSIFLYADAEVRRCITCYKGEGVVGMADFFTERLAEVYLRRYAGLPLVPVPFRRDSVRKRGFDQVMLLCGGLQKEYGIPHLSLLRREGKNREQKLLNRDEREKNLRGRIFPRKQVPGNLPSEVVLLDDVFTTGATANECARVLQDMGIRRIFVLTLARD